MAKVASTFPSRASPIRLQKFVSLALVLISLGFFGSEIGRTDIYVGNLGGNALTVYNDEAEGNAAPIRMLQGPDTGLNTAAGIALDLVHSEFFLIPEQLLAKVNVYQLNADGNEAPIRSIDGAKTGIEGAVGIAVDPISDELYVASYTNASIRVFSRAASGDVSPIRVIEGSETGLTGPSGIFVDLEHDEIFVSNIENLGGGALVGSILVFPRVAVGNVPPKRSIEGPSALLQAPQWIFASQEHDELYVSDQLGGVNVYIRAAEGEAAPIRRIVGPNSMLSAPLGILLTAEGELVLANAGGNSILFFPRMADGDIAPSRIISGDATGLNLPYTLGSTLAAEGSVGYAGPLCQPEMGLSCPPSDDPLSFISGGGLDVQINGAVFAPEPCEPVARIHWEWGDGTSNDSGFPASHSYTELSDYTITTSAFDAGDNLIATASCNISLQIIFTSSFEQ